MLGVIGRELSFDEEAFTIDDQEVRVGHAEVVEGAPRARRAVDSVHGADRD